MTTSTEVSWAASEVEVLRLGLVRLGLVRLVTASILTRAHSQPMDAFCVAANRLARVCHTCDIGLAKRC